MAPRTNARRLLASLAVAVAVGAISTPAHASCGGGPDCGPGTMCDGITGTCKATPVPAPGSPAEAREVAGLLFSGFGMGFSVFGLLLAAKTLDVVYKPPACGVTCWNSAQITLYVYGGALAVLGGMGVGLQATVSEPCGFKSLCQVSYGLGGTSLGIGALMLVEGIYVSAVPPWTRRAAWIKPVPVLIPTLRGSTVGLGLTGRNL